jgi:hypothetical protein
MYRIIYKGRLSRKANFHTIADSFADAIQNFKESTAYSESRIISIEYLD